MDKLKSQLKPTYLLILIVLLIGAGFVIAEFDEVLEAIQKADLRALPGAIFFTFISYLSMSISFALVCRLFNIQMPFRSSAEVGYITNVLNHVVTAGGVAGLSLRFILMGRHGVAIRDAVAVSMMHFYLASLDMMVMLPVGLFYLTQNATLARGITILLSVSSAILILLALLATAIIFQPAWRQSVLRILATLGSRLLRRDLRSTFKQFDKSMRRGITVMKEKPGLVLLVIALTILDWICSVIVLSYCLDAFGTQQPFGVVMTAFVIGIVVGLASMIPGGIGFQEGAITWVLVLLGVRFGQAVLASILFRAVFFLLPYLASLIFYRQLLNPKLVEESGSGMEV